MVVMTEITSPFIMDSDRGGRDDLGRGRKPVGELLDK